MLYINHILYEIFSTQTLLSEPTTNKKLKKQILIKNKSKKSKKVRFIFYTSEIL